ncbi:MAG TPA: cytochrome c [Candidatus Angelobacter sp.]|nr:cytochrome c [Candidatus Angelobacter sp.]
MVLLVMATAWILSGCRQDMHNQPKFIPFRSSEFFPDHRSERYPIAGTIPRMEDAALDREQLDPNSYYLTGKHGDSFGNDLPPEIKLDRNLLLRGQERFNIYCEPCHSRVGDGNGMIVQRGFKHPPTFHQARLRNAPIGHFYDVISHGFGAMPDYAAQVHPRDRWAIAVYIRALQLSQDATVADVPPQDQKELNTPTQPIQIPDTSYVSPTALQPNATQAPPAQLKGGVKP